MSKRLRSLSSVWMADEQRWIREVLGAFGRPRSNGLLEMLSFITLVTVSAAAWLAVAGIVLTHVI